MATTELPPAAPPGQTGVRISPWPVVLVAGAFVLAHLPLLSLHAGQIWLRPHYQFFPLLLVGAAALFALRLRGVGTLSPGPTSAAAALLAAGWLILAAAELLHSSWLGAVAALVTLAATCFAVGGTALLARAWPALLLLAVAVPPPFELDRTLILGLQGLTARWGSGVLDLLGVPHLLAGNVVEVSGRRFLVEEACSGVNSLFSVVAATLFFVLLTRRPPLAACLLVAAGVGWVLVANVLRVVLITYAGVVWGVELGEGWRHTAVGLALFALAMLLVWSTDRLLVFLTATAVEPVPAPEAAVPRTAPTVPAVVWGVAGAFLLLPCAHLTLYGAERQTETASRQELNPDGLGEESLPPRLGRWRRQGFVAASRNPGSAFGEFSRTWTYHLGGNAGHVSLDYPFPGWHDLTRCYTGQGWVVEEQLLRPGQPDGDEGFVEVRLVRPAYRSGFLLFAQFDGRGTPLEPRRGGAYLSLHRHDSALRRWWRPAEEARTDPPGPVYQAQLFVESYAPLSPADEGESRALFAHALAALRTGAASAEE
jgi:exosortase